MAESLTKSLKSWNIMSSSFILSSNSGLNLINTLTVIVNPCVNIDQIITHIINEGLSPEAILLGRNYVLSSQTLEVPFVYLTEKRITILTNLLHQFILFFSQHTSIGLEQSMTQNSLDVMCASIKVCTVLDLSLRRVCVCLVVVVVWIDVIRSAAAIDGSDGISRRTAVHF